MSSIDQLKSRPTRTGNLNATITRFARLAMICMLFTSATGFAETPAVGVKAPDFELATPLGQTIRLSSLTAKGTVVLVVLRGYPGYQCPYCIRQVHDFTEHASAFTAKKAMVLFVYPGPPAELDVHAKEFLAKQADLPANIHLVTDPDYAVTKLYGLRWDAAHETAYPSTFILNDRSSILFEKVSRGHGDRTSAEDVLAQLPPH